MKKRSKNFRKERGISPVIATVLLVAMVIVIALIIFMWFKSLSQEAITKFGGENIQTVCQEVSFSADYNSYTGQLSFVNNGNVPIYSMELKISSAGGNYETSDINNITGDWPNTGLRVGGVYGSGNTSSIEMASQITAIPVLLGTSSSGQQQTYTCPDQYGQQISMS